MAVHATRGALPMMALLFGANATAWWWAWWIGGSQPLFLGTCLLAYGLGLRHAFDADHIAGIDNVTRSLTNDRGAPVTVGLWFALGHSTVVVSACAAVALTIGLPHAWLPQLQRWGTSGGAMFSALFLCLAAGVNAVSLLAMLRARRGGGAPHASSRGWLSTAVKPLLRWVSRPWQMVFVGLLFGLGFDTASEVGLLGLSVGTAPHALSPGSMMVLPLLFTAGMSLADGADGALMARAYGWALERPQRRLAYNMIVTSLSIIAAVVVAMIEAGKLVRDHYMFRGGVWNLIVWTSNRSALLGSLVLAILLGCWVVVWLGRFDTPRPTRGVEAVPRVDGK